MNKQEAEEFHMQRRQIIRARQIIAVLLIAFWAALFAALSGCALIKRPNPVPELHKIEVPVIQMVLPPDQLLRPYQPARIPQIIPPADPRASSCVMPEGEDRLIEILTNHRYRDKALQTWADENKAEE